MLQKFFCPLLFLIFFFFFLKQILRTLLGQPRFKKLFQGPRKERDEIHMKSIFVYFLPPTHIRQVVRCAPSPESSLILFSSPWNYNDQTTQKLELRHQNTKMQKNLINFGQSVWVIPLCKKFTWTLLVLTLKCCTWLDLSQSRLSKIYFVCGDIMIAVK